MPAIAPLTSAVRSRRPSTPIPANRAASGLSPIARSRSPVAVRASTNQAIAMIASASTKPRWTRESERICGNSAFAEIRSDSGNFVTGLRHGPLSRPVTRSRATGLRSSVVTTSSMPRCTRISAGPSTHTAPPSAPATDIAAIASGRGTPLTCVPIQAAAIAPARSCPSAPMFQKPARNAIATAAPVKRSGVAATSTSSPV